MKQRILSVLTALALCLSLCPVTALAANETLTKPLDFTNVGDGEGQTPASGDGYTWTGDAGSGYTLTLNGITINSSETELDWNDTQAAIRLPSDGPITIELNGENTITAVTGSAIACYGSNAVTIQGSGALNTNTEISVTGGMTIKKAAITIQTTEGDGIRCGAGISIENANLTITAQGTNGAAISATNDIIIKNSDITVSSNDSHGIYTVGSVTITGGTISATSKASGAGAISAIKALTVEGGAKVTATGAYYGLYSEDKTTLSQSEISAVGTGRAAILSRNGIIPDGVALLEPSTGKIGGNGVVDYLNGTPIFATSSKLAPIDLETPASPLICTYGDTSVSVTLTSTPASGGGVTITDKDNTKVGSGNLGQPIDIDASGFHVGDVTLTAIAGGITETFTVTVKPKTLTVTGATATGRAYDGTKEVAVTAVTLDGVLDADSGKVSVNTANLKGTIDSSNAGTYDSVTLPTLELTGTAAGNYTLTQPTGAVTASVTISKGTYAGTKAAETSGKFGVSKTFDLKDLLPAGYVLGTPSKTDGNGIFEGEPTLDGTKLTYKLADDKQKVGKTGTITVPVTESTNYGPFDLTITVTVADKYVPTLTVSPITVTYSGEAVPGTAIKGTAKVGDTTVIGTWSFKEGQALTDVADSGTKAVLFTPDDAANYAAAEGTVSVTINKATPTGAPKYTAISTSGKTLADAGLTTVGGTFSTTGTVAWTLAGTTEVTANTTYEWTFTPTDTANYNTLTGKITLWVQSTGGGSTQTTPPVTTDKTTEGGASSTETTAKPYATTKGDTASSTVSSSVGNEIVKQAEKNKSDNVVIAPEITGDVTRTEVSIPASTVGEIGSKTEASLTISTPVADVTIPNGGLGSLASEGGTISVTAEVKGNAVELSVTAGGKTVDSIPGGVTVTVPVEETKPGTVAVLVREDGTRQVIRKSAAGENGVTVPLDGSAKIEIVDNGKVFNDVPADNWAADAVAFASAHELFNGTSDTTFSPELPMSRGMLAVVLHNLESNPDAALSSTFSDVDSGKWYAEGVSWAAAKGIITGYGNGQFGPDDDITREQLAVMLWRYAGSPAATDKELHFTDADKASGYALDALRWAVENGILNGRGNGILDPGGKATRAEAAQMMKNFLEKR